MTIAFTKVALPYGWLGNMSPHPVDHAGATYRTAEHLFQALRFTDPGIRARIRARASPMAAKMYAKTYAAAYAVAPTSPADVTNMRRVVRLKLAQHPALKADLLATGDAPIVEDVTARPGGRNRFWGAARRPDGTWDGENTLGRLWQEVRAELRAPRVIARVAADPAGPAVVDLVGRPAAVFVDPGSGVVLVDPGAAVHPRPGVRFTVFEVAGWDPLLVLAGSDLWLPVGTHPDAAALAAWAAAANARVDAAQPVESKGDPP